MKTEFLCITGAPKSGTSTLVGILNCHPEILILYEFLSTFPKVGPRDKRYNIGMNNKLLPIISAMHGKKTPLHKLMIMARDIFCENNSYKYFGTKFGGLDTKSSEFWGKCKCIYTVRDIRTWMAKDAINTMFFIRKNKSTFTRTAINYIIQFIKTYTMDDCMKISMESLVLSPETVISKIDKYLNLDVSYHSFDWQNKIGKYEDKVKLIYPDWSRHPSTFNIDRNLDKYVSITDNKIWTHILTIFDKYYNNLDLKFSDEEIETDCKILNDIKVDRTKYISFGDIYPYEIIKNDGYE